MKQYLLILTIGAAVVELPGAVAQSGDVFAPLLEPDTPAETVELTVTGEGAAADAPGDFEDLLIPAADAAELDPLRLLRVEPLSPRAAGPPPTAAPITPRPPIAPTPTAAAGPWWQNFTRQWHREQVVVLTAVFLTLMLTLLYLGSEVYRFVRWRKSLGRHMHCDGCGYPLPNRYSVVCNECGKSRIFLFPRTPWGWYVAYRKQRHSQG